MIVLIFNFLTSLINIEYDKIIQYQPRICFCFKIVPACFKLNLFYNTICKNNINDHNVLKEICVLFL